MTTLTVGVLRALIADFPDETKVTVSDADSRRLTSVRTARLAYTTMGYSVLDLVMDQTSPAQTED